METENKPINKPVPMKPAVPEGPPRKARPLYNPKNIPHRDQHFYEDTNYYKRYKPRDYNKRQNENQKYADGTKLPYNRWDNYQKYPTTRNSPNDGSWRYGSNNSAGFYRCASDCENAKIIDVREPLNTTISTLDDIPARITFIPNYFLKNEADDLYEWLSKNLNWQQREGVNKNGEKYYEPRQTCWFGKPYKYSSVSWSENKSWDDKLENLRVKLCKDHEVENSKEYNSVMCNYYRDHKDLIGWHADDETSLGRYPKIASISLGSERVFEVCKRKEYYSRYRNAGKPSQIFNGCTILYRFHLNHGSLLIMEGSVQEEWLHRVPKEKDPTEGRINLTYRHIVTDLEEKEEINRRKSPYKPNRSSNYGTKTLKEKSISTEAPSQDVNMLSDQRTPNAVNKICTIQNEKKISNPS